MADHFLETKLIPARQRTQRVARPRLGQPLRRGSEVTLTLVSAPAGFGKTTLLASWVGRDDGGRTAWVSLDEQDRDGSSFWTYVLLAVERAAPGTAGAALALLRSGQVPIDTVLAALLNELSVFPEDLTMVLDDYHLADGPDVHSGMAFLLDHLSPQVHVVISTRADPALPLARLRARGQLVEIRAADLRFTADEVATYLNDVNALGLAAADLAALEARTEGWVAALQLAALSLQGRDDPARFIAGFAGDDRYVVDYLADEVLDRLPADLRGFLLQTSVLDRLTGPLCDAVTGRSGARAMLESLERQNLFVVPLDGHRRWYRYHHLFADVLQAHLLGERPDQVAELHRRASIWFQQADEPEPAVRHAVAAGDVDRAADLVELALPRLRRERREAVIRRWADDLPADIAKDRPVLAVGFIGAFAASNDFGGVEQRLRDAQRLLAEPVDRVLASDHAELARLPGAIETYWAALALVTGDLAGTVHHAELALAGADDGDLLTVAAASALAGLASWTQGDISSAHRNYTAAAEDLARAGHVADVLGCSIALADMAMTQGRLRDAEHTLRGALELAEPWGVAMSPVRGTADMYVGLSRVAWEHGDLVGAAECLDRADRLGDEAGLPQNPYRWLVAMAQVRASQGETETAVGLLEEAERVYVGDFSPDVRPVAAARARLLACAGDLAGALTWARQRDLSAADELSYLREYEHVTLVRILLAEHASSGAGAALADASALLERLLVAAERGGRAGTVIELLALQSLARRAARKHEQALATLERAARLAEPQGYVSIFAAEGAPMLDLLTALEKRRRGWSFARRLFAATNAAVAARGGLVSGSAGHAGHTNQSGQFNQSRPGAVPGAMTRTGQSGDSVLVEPLSDRELSVLRLLCSELDGPAIARELSVSLSTVRTHTQHIYSKLDVNNRRAAVRRAHQLNLFTHARQR